MDVDDRHGTSSLREEERASLLEGRRSGERGARDTKPSTLLTVCPFILGNEFCERLAFYGLSTNLVIYLTRVMGYDSGFAAVQVSLFEGSCYLSPLLGAWLADSIWGRYRTILVFSLIYLVGMVSLAASAAIPGLTPPPDRFPTLLQSAALYVSLYIVALGTGGIKPNVSAFGADQFDETNAQDRKEKKSFFNWFYFSINLGSLLAVTCIVWIQENLSWAIGFAIPAACMAIAILVFIAGSRRYKHVAPSESPFSRVFNVVWAAYKARRAAAGRRYRQLPAVDSHGNAITNGDGGNGLSSEGYERLSSPRREATAGFSTHRSGYEMDTTAEALLNNIDTVFDGSYENEDDGRTLAHTDSFIWLDAATTARTTVGGGRKFSRQQVEEVKLVLRMLPIFFATILYWTIYMQMGSFFVVQGAHLDRRVNLGGLSGWFTIPAASLSMINTFAIVLLIPVYDKVLVPMLRRLGRPMTLLKRIGWGLIVCMMAMLTAAVVERRRLKLYDEGDVIDDDFRAAGDMDDRNAERISSSLESVEHSPYGDIVNMSVWWQIPQYLLIGLSEVFTSIGQLEFFYDQAPDVMRSCSMALQLLSVCIGSYLSGAVVWATSVVTSRLDPSGEGWLPKDLNQGHLDFFFLFLGGLMAINLCFFLFVAIQYEYKSVEHKHTAAPRVILQGGLPLRPEPRPITAPVPSMRPSAAHPMATGAESVGASPATPGFYGRSVTYLPQTPALPAPFR